MVEAYMEGYKPQYRIEEWKIIETSFFYISGFIKGRHPWILEKEPAHTSKLLFIDFQRMKAETKNSIYLLGKPCSDSRSW